MTFIFVEQPTKVQQNKKPRAKFFKPCPDIKLKILLKPIKDGYLLKNGLRCDRVKLEIVKLPTKQTIRRAVQLTNTCPFDAITHLILMSALDYPNCENYVRKSDAKFFKFIEIFMSNEPGKITSESRATLLRSIYPSNSTFEVDISTLLEINAWDAITPAWSQLMVSEPSMIETEECSGKCQYKQTTKRIEIVPNWAIIVAHGFNSLKEAIAHNYGIKSIPGVTPGCRGRRTVGKFFQNFLYIELEVIDTASKMIKTGVIKDFPVLIELSGAEFRYDLDKL